RGVQHRVPARPPARHGWVRRCDPLVRRGHGGGVEGRRGRWRARLRTGRRRDARPRGTGPALPGAPRVARAEPRGARGAPPRPAAVGVLAAVGVPQGERRLPARRARAPAGPSPAVAAGGRAPVRRRAPPAVARPGAGPRDDRRRRRPAGRPRRRVGSRADRRSVIAVSTEPDISVVVPTFRRSAGLARLADALEAQTLDHARFEVVIVADCSPDVTDDDCVPRPEWLEQALTTCRATPDLAVLQGATLRPDGPYPYGPGTVYRETLRPSPYFEGC